MALARCILGKSLGVGCHFLPPHLDVPTFSAKGKGIMARRRGFSCNDVLDCLDVLGDVDNEREEDIEDSLSWDESDPSPMKFHIPTVK
jgi:hypothetical protein